MSLLSSHDQQHLARMFAQEQRVNGLYTRFISSVAPELRKWKDSGRTNVWLRNSAIENIIDKRLIEFQSLLENEIKNGSLRAWDLSDEKNDRLVENYIKNLSISDTAKNGMFVRNADALAGFQNRVENGLTLSDKVWNITQQTKGNVELYLQSGIGTGQSAETISRDIKQLLNEPDKVFRRIRNEKGDLIPSKPMKDYHPGAGTYRSSKKNAMRLAATETNMGYRVADSERWKNLDFVLGFEIKRSGNGGPCSVCDSLKGKYPKGFIFSGWHSWCICFAVPILMGHDDFADFLLSDSVPANQLITEIPKGAEEWLAANEKLVEKSYWKKANTEIIKNGITPIEKQKIPAPTIKNEYENNILQVERKLSIKKGKEMSFDEANEQKGNINYTKDIGYRVNCQSCVTSNELRRRGFDVTALPNLKKRGNIPYELSRKTEMAWIDPKTGVYPEKFKAGGKVEFDNKLKPKPKSMASIAKDLNEFTNEVGRYHIDFVWKGGKDGHIITLERLKNGNISMYDPQNGKIVHWSDLSKKIASWHGINILRVDNLFVNNEIIAGIVTKL